MNTPRRLLSLFLLLILIALGTTACGSDDNKDSSNSSVSYKTVDAKTAYQHLKEDPGAIFLDVRTPEEWNAVHPDGVILIPLEIFDEFDQRAPENLRNAKETPVYVICNSGNRSQIASEKLVEMGYTQVFNMDGGIQAWQQARLPVILP